MYQVALCDDEKIFADTQENICRDIFNKLNIEYQLTVFGDSADFIESFVKDRKKYDLILLDIIMEGTNGIELAKMIRDTDSEVTIIFITSHHEYALHGYEVKALHYLIKPLKSEVLEKLIKADYHKRFKCSFFIFEWNGIKQKTPIKEIICMETAGRRVEVTLKNGTVYYSGKLVNLLAELPGPRFVRCHQAFAINISNIRELTNRDAIAVNDKVIPVSRTFMKDVQKAFARELRDG